MYRSLYNTTNLLFFVIFALVLFKILNHPVVKTNHPFFQEVTTSVDESR